MHISFGFIRDVFDLLYQNLESVLCLLTAILFFLVAASRVAAGSAQGCSYSYYLSVEKNLTAVFIWVWSACASAEDSELKQTTFNGPLLTVEVCADLGYILIFYSYPADEAIKKSGSIFHGYVRSSFSSWILHSFLLANFSRHLYYSESCEVDTSFLSPQLRYSCSRYQQVRCSLSLTLHSIFICNQLFEPSVCAICYCSGFKPDAIQLYFWMSKPDSNVQWRCIWTFHNGLRR